ncbi:50S ribosomal protein L18 [Candidatus Woesebacteria bacterium]|jgi:large subunit ribosomal protein L18|nr:50S ribosomal protein L18 [Candidatus Woesebacteria bacterium]
MANKIIARRERIKKRVRSRIVRKSDYPRLTVHRSNNHIYAQVIDDHKMVTLAAASDIKLTDKKMNRIDKTKEVALALAEQMKKKKITQVVFDRGCYQFKGRVKALAEGVRAAGITI